jgi:hypothetical protein
VLPEPKRFSAVEAEIASAKNATSLIETRATPHHAIAPACSSRAYCVQVIAKSVTNKEHHAQLRQ